MFKRVRQLKISLAAKCQLLFGVAVVLIIAAALLVPWRRMDQLTAQIDERAARTLAENVKLAHIADPRIGRFPPTTIPAPAIVPAPTTLPVSATSPSTQPAPYIAPRMVSALLSPKELDRQSSFDRRALGYLSDDPEDDSFARYYNSKAGFRYALALYNEQDCMRCHSEAPAEASADVTIPSTHPSLAAMPRKFPTTRPGALLGIVSVDIRSQVDVNQLLLNKVFILAAGLLAGTLAILVFYLITTRLILQPVRVLQETAEKVSEGDLNIRSDISTGDEFQQLSETFNTMLTNLKESADQLRAINKGLDLKLGELAESNVALYESNRLKSEFLANVSHELRTPLNSILGFAEILKESIGTTEPKTVRYIQNILNSGQNLLDLINDLLDLAKIEAGRMEVRSEPLSVNDLFEGLGNILKPLAEPKNLIVTDDVAADVPILHTDPAKLQQVLYNFLSNAIKFSPPGGQITLTARMDDPEHVRIEVKDQGPGIDPEKHGVIFEKFRQIDGSVTRQHSGTGLGLAISKELIGLLGGAIGVISAPDQGAIFWVRLPLKIQPSTADLRAKLVLT